MPIWSLLAVFGGLATGVVLAMVIGFQMLEKSAMQQCVHTKQKQHQPQSQTGISGERSQCQEDFQGSRKGCQSG